MATLLETRADSSGLRLRNELGVPRLYPLAVLLAHIFGRVVLEYGVILVGDCLGGGFGHGWECFFFL